MILQSDCQRVIFWGAEILPDGIRAELAFFGSSIGNPLVVLKSEDSQSRVAINIPEQYLLQDFGNRAQNIFLPTI